MPQRHVTVAERSDVSPLLLSARSSPVASRKPGRTHSG